MGEEESSNGKSVSATIDAITGLVKAVPIYDDMVQPVAKQLGKSFETVGKLVNVALAPVGLLVWGYDKCENFINTKVADRLKNVPPEEIIPPKPNVAGPAIEALRYAGHEESLSDMYANLLATAMDKNIADTAHPAFVEIIKQLTPDEARLMNLFMQQRPFPIITVRAEHINEVGGITIAHHLSVFGEQAGVTVQNLVPAYLGNLDRLGLISIRDGESYTAADLYAELEKSEQVQHFVKVAAQEADKSPRLIRGLVRITDFGAQFGNACVVTRSEMAPDIVVGPPQ
jgi:hypothetical protein